MYLIVSYLLIAAAVVVVADVSHLFVGMMIGQTTTTETEAVSTIIYLTIYFLAHDTVSDDFIVIMIKLEVMRELTVIYQVQNYHFILI